MTCPAYCLVLIKNQSIAYKQQKTKFQIFRTNPQQKNITCNCFEVHLKESHIWKPMNLNWNAQSQIVQISQHNLIVRVIIEFNNG